MAGRKQEIERVQVIPIEGEKSWAVPSSTDKGVTYKVELLDDGQLRCNCMAGLNGRDCRHRKAVRIAEGMKETYMCYQAVRDMDDMSSAIPVFQARDEDFEWLRRQKEVVTVGKRG